MIIKANIRKVFDTDKPIKATASILIDDAVAIHNIGVGENEKGRFISMPSFRCKNKDGEEFKSNVCHPISSSARKVIENAVFTAYDEKLAGISANN